LVLSLDNKVENDLMRRPERGDWSGGLAIGAPHL
jgi:hypothetical protein